MKTVKTERVDRTDVYLGKTKLYCQGNKSEIAMIDFSVVITSWTKRIGQTYEVNKRYVNGGKAKMEWHVICR